MGTLEQEIALIIEGENLQHIHQGETPQFVEEFKKLLKRIDTARRTLSMEWVKVDRRGRVTIPQDYRLLLGIESGNELECHLNDPANPKYLMLRKAF